MIQLAKYGDYYLMDDSPKAIKWTIISEEYMLRKCENDLKKFLTLDNQENLHPVILKKINDPKLFRENFNRFEYDKRALALAIVFTDFEFKDILNLIDIIDQVYHVRIYELIYPMKLDYERLIFLEKTIKLRDFREIENINYSIIKRLTHDKKFFEKIKPYVRFSQQFLTMEQCRKIQKVCENEPEMLSRFLELLEYSINAKTHWWIDENPQLKLLKRFF